MFFSPVTAAFSLLRSLGTEISRLVYSTASSPPVSHILPPRPPPSDGPPTMDPRCAFLRTTSDKLPLDVTFEFEPVKTRGQVAMHYWPPKRGVDRPPEALIYFILGNPGVLDYYTPFLNYLREQIPDAHAILCTSHIGCDLRLPGPKVPLDLLENLETKIECAEALRASLTAWAAETGAPEPKLALMGHSIGAWLSAEVMKRMSIHVGYLLFPTLGWIAQTRNAKQMWPMFRRPVRALLPHLGRLGKRIAPILPMTVCDTSIRFITSPDTVRHSLALGRSEMLTLGAPDTKWYQSQREKIPGMGVYGLWASGDLDGWVGREGPIVRECIGTRRARLIDDVPHAFCLQEEHWTLVADVVTEWIVQHMPGKPEETDGILDGMVNDMPNGNGVPNGMSVLNGAPNGVRNGVPNEVPSGVANGVPNGVPSGVPKGVTNGSSILNGSAAPNGTDNAIANGVPNGLSTGGLPSGNPSAIDKAVDHAVSEAVSNGFPNGFPNIPNGIPNGIPN